MTQFSRDSIKTPARGSAGARHFGGAGMDAPGNRPERVLFVGRDRSGISRHLASGDTAVVIAPFGTLDAAFLARVAPQAVAFPLMGPESDAAQMLAQLDLLGFRGEAIILAPRLPDRAMVLRELRPLAPRLTRITLLDQPDP